MKHLLLFSTLLCAAAGSAVAQPIFTQQNFSGMIGDTYVVHDFPSATEEPGANGANQTWNFAGIGQGMTQTIEITDPADTPMGADYPTATFAGVIGGSQYIFMRIDNSGLYTVGAAMPGGIDLQYSNVRTEMVFPITFGHSFSDHSTYTSTVGGLTMNTEADITITADGYGSITTPSGTFSNALRLHAVENSISTMDVGGGGEVEIVSETESYLWMVSGVPLPVFSHITVTSQGQAPSTSLRYMSGITTDVSEAPEVEVTIYPNPAIEYLKIEAPEVSGQMTVDVMDVKGALVTSYTGAANTIAEIGVGHLENGIYFVHVTTEEGFIVKKITKL